VLIQSNGRYTLGIIFFSLIAMQYGYGQCSCPAGATTLTTKVATFTIAAGQTYCASANVSTKDLNVAGSLYIAANAKVTVAGNMNLTGSGVVQACKKGGFDVSGTVSLASTSTIIMNGGSYSMTRGSLTTSSASASIQMGNCAVFEVCGGFTPVNNNVFQYIGTTCQAQVFTRGSSSGPASGTFSASSKVTWVNDGSTTISRGSAVYCGPFAYFSSLACAPAGGAACGSGETLAKTNYDNFAVPISLIDFSARATAAQLVTLNWETATETGNDYFTVQKSTDGATFIAVATVKSKAQNGNSSSNLTYSFQDESAAGSYYYRLMQTDYDGKTSYSGIVYSKAEAGKNPVIWPNPATDLINISLANVATAVVVAYTPLGYAIELPVTGKDELAVQVNTSSLKPGIYFIVARGNDNSAIHYRLVIK
jgi:hypothetical protein